MIHNFNLEKNRILHLYGLMDGTVDVQDSDPDVVICVDEFGPLNLQPHPDRHWTLAGGGGPTPRRRRRATYKRPHGVRHLLAAYDLSRNKLYGHIKPRKRRGEFLAFLRYVRSLYPPAVRIAIVVDNYSPYDPVLRRPLTRHPRRLAATPMCYWGNLVPRAWLARPAPDGQLPAGIIAVLETGALTWSISGSRRPPTSAAGGGSALARLWFRLPSPASGTLGVDPSGSDHDGA